MRKTLVLFFSFRISLKDWYDAGILEREVKLYNELSKYFYKIYFLTYGGKDDKKYQSYLASNIKIVPMPLIHRGGRKQFRPLLLIYSILMPFIHWKILKNAGILKTNQIPGCWAAVMAKMIFQKTLILRCGYIWSCFAFQNGENVVRVHIKKMIERVSCALSDVVICSSVSDQKYLQRHYKAKARVIPNYVDTEIFKPLNIPRKKDTICFVGRLERQKNLPVLLEAIKGLPYQLTIIGNGSMRNRLERKAKADNINVRLMNSVSHSKLPEILNEHEIFILPSLYEGTPKVLLEAMSCGLPVIGTNVKGIKDIIEHKKNGYLCESSLGSIRNAILQLFGDKQARENIAKEARETVSGNFSFDNILEREISIYQEIIPGQEIKICMFGRDYVGWSIDKDREAITNFLKVNNFKITKNILQASHIFCVWHDLLLSWKYKWILYLKRVLNKKLLAVITNDITVYPEKLEMLKKYVDVFVAPSQKIYEYLKTKKIEVFIIPFFVDPDIFHPINLSKQEICKKLRIDYSKIENKMIIGSFVRDSLGKDLSQPKWQKNPDLLITVLSRLPKGKYLLLLAGPRRHYIVKKCKLEKIPFLFYGEESPIYQQRDDILSNNLPLHIINYLYNLSDIYIISSRNEGGPKQALECALTKTVVFSTRVGLVPDFVHPYLIYEEDKLGKVIEKISDFLEDKNDYEEYAEYNYLRAKEEMDSNKLKEKYKKLFWNSNEN